MAMEADTPLICHVTIATGEMPRVVACWLRECWRLRDTSYAVITASAMRYMLRRYYCRDNAINITTLLLLLLPLPSLPSRYAMVERYITRWLP